MKRHAEMFDVLCAQEKALHVSKNHDYSAGGPALGNFERIAAILRLYPKLALDDSRVVALVYLLKQLDAVLWGLNSQIKHKCEGVTDRLRDISVYAKIVQCILLEQQAALRPACIEHNPKDGQPSGVVGGKTVEDTP